MPARTADHLNWTIIVSAHTIAAVLNLLAFGLTFLGAVQQVRRGAVARAARA